MIETASIAVWYFVSIFGIAAVVFCCWSLLYDKFKEREWKRNNPDDPWSQ